MSINGQQEYLLQVASGLHRGVEQALPLGEYSLGRDPGCDIVLSDGSIEDLHLRLNFETRKVILTPEQGRVLLNEQAIEGPTELVMPCRLSLGTVLIELDRLFELDALAYDDEENFFVDEDPRVGAGAGAAAAAGAAAMKARQAGGNSAYVDDDGRSPSLGERVGGFFNRSSDDDGQAYADTRGGHDRGGGGGFGRWFVLVGMLALIPLGAVPLYLLMTSGFNEQATSQQSSASASQQIRSILADLGLSDSARVSGFTPLQEAPIALYGDRARLMQTELSQRLTQADIPHQINVYDSFELAERANAVARDLGYNVLVEPGGTGEVVISGFVDNDEDLARLVRGFDQQVPGIHHANTERLVVGTIALNKAQELVSRAGLSEYLTVERQVNTVLANGTLPSSARDNWLAVRSQFDTLYAPYMQITDSMMDDGGGSPVLPIKAIWAGLRPYIIFDDGGVYFEGTVVEGWTIESIRDDRVVVRRDNEVVDLTF